MSESPEKLAPKSVPPRSPQSVPTMAQALQSEKAGAHIMAARRALRKGNRDEARTLLKQAFAASPNDQAGLELLGDLFLEEGEQAKAVAVFERGKKLYPRHASFEEKIALAQLDLAEIEHDKILRQQFAQDGDTEAWQDRKPNVSALISALVPGLGQVYNDHWERGAAFLSAAIISFAGWLWPLSSGLRAASTGAAKNAEKDALRDMAAALVGMSPATKLFLVLCFMAGMAIHAYAAWDAAQLAIRGAQDRKRRLGIWE